MAYKKISELPEFSGSTYQTWLLINNSGETETFKIQKEDFISGLSNNIEVTYSELVDKITGETLNIGGYYIITDFKTCYDQPDYDYNQNAITSGIYKDDTTIQPIIVFATSSNTISDVAYQPSYPNDRIRYDWTFSATERTSGVSYGRISERIDEFNNRTDYDHRNILFKRYYGYSYDESNPLGGLVGISGLTGTTGVLYGDTGTTFNSNFSTGSFVAVTNISPSIFEVISIESDSLAIISGTSISETSNSPYYSVTQDGIMSYYQPNVRQDEVFEYTTFGNVITPEYALNNYIGNQANLFIKQGTGDFLLANNVFLDGAIINNTIGNGSYNNTFNDDCDNNQIGDRFYNNSTNDDFDGNIIGENFNNNFITSNFNNNRIGSNFEDNILLGGSFYRNNIGNDFNSNVWTNGDFQNNEIGNQFNNNKIYDDFYNNDIGNGYNNNDTYRSFYRNLIGNGYNNNTVYSDFYDNEIGQVFNSNTISTLEDIGSYDFYGNKIGTDFYNNVITRDFRKNDIGHGFYDNNISGDTSTNRIGEQFVNNTIYGDFYDNQIFNEFKGNITYGDFNTNKVDWGFTANEISGSCFDNAFGPYIISNDFLGSVFGNTFVGGVVGNTIGDDFATNNIGINFINNTIGEGFGYGGSTPQGNIIGNGFIDNMIGEYFYNNSIPDNFDNNIIGNYFQWNVINTNVNTVDFTTYYGVIQAVTYVSTGTSATDNTYTALTGATTGTGVNASFDIVVSGGTVTGVTINTYGKLYQTGDTITILGTQIGGIDPDDNIVFTVTEVTETPPVYEPFTCYIFERQGGVKRLSYYDASDVLQISTLNNN